MEKIKSDIVGLLAKNPNGLTAHEIRNKTNHDVVLLKRYVEELFKEGAISIQGMLHILTEKGKQIR